MSPTSRSTRATRATCSSSYGQGVWLLTPQEARTSAYGVRFCWYAA
ncbi:hypothetical protein [Kribbella sp. DT2]